MILERTLRGGRGLMLALDVQSTDVALELIQKTSPYIAAIKIGWHLMLRAAEGPEVIRSIARSTNIPILVDPKVHDVPHIAIEMIRAFADQGARAVTIWGERRPSRKRRQERQESFQFVCPTGS